MGHFYEVIEAEGQNRSEAFWAAWDEYEREHGTRCSLRSDWLAKRDRPVYGDGGDSRDVDDYGDGKPCCYAELVERVPPMKWVEESETKRSYDPVRGYYRTMTFTRMVQQRDQDAPQSAWRERWRFRVHYHA